MLKFFAWLSAAWVVTLPLFLVAAGVIDNGIDVLLTGLTWQCAATCLWFGMGSIIFSTALTLWLRERVQPQNRLVALAAPNTFAVYLFHPLVLVPLSYAFTFIALPALAKFALVSLLTVALCYPLAAALRRIPGARTIL